MSGIFFEGFEQAFFIVRSSDDVVTDHFEAVLKGSNDAWVVVNNKDFGLIGFFLQSKKIKHTHPLKLLSISHSPDIY